MTKKRQWMLNRPNPSDMPHNRPMASLDPWAPSDPLARALGVLRVDGVFYCRSELTAPWGMSLPPMPGYMWFHVVTAGRTLLQAEFGDDGDWLGPADLALVPHGHGHMLRSDPQAATRPILELDREQVSERYEILRYGGGGASTTLICGAVRLGHPTARRLVQALPAAILVQAGHTAPSDWMFSTLRLIADEAEHPQTGAEAVITRLGDILVIQALRRWLATDPAARTGWLGALQDPQIGAALTLMHRDPARGWTLSELAGEVALSRSAFAARFTELVGEPAMAYLARWRMHLALDELQERRGTVGELAARFGYRSEAAFARAFKRIIGMPPGAVRRSPPIPHPG
jgi:AraC-like DNA-binding protein